MAGFQNYSYLPGHIAQFKNGNLNLPNDPNPSTTESILILGTATDGPTHQPVRVTPDNVRKLFGKEIHPNGVPNGATLVAKFDELWQGGNRDVRLMRISGQRSSLTLEGASYNEVEALPYNEVVGTTVGNDEAIFTLPHGGIDLSSVVVYADGTEISGTSYVVDPGTAQDDFNMVAMVEGTLTIAANAVQMEAEIAISYVYESTDSTGTTNPYVVENQTTDAYGVIMKCTMAVPQSLPLTKVPNTGLQLYVNGELIVDDPAAPLYYEVDASVPEVRILSNSKFDIGQEIEVAYAYDEVTTITPTIVLNSIFAGEVYNELKTKVEVNNGIVTLTIQKPEAKKAQIAEQPIVLTSKDYPSFQLFVQAINAHPENNVVEATTKFNDVATNVLLAKPLTSFTGGNSEINLSKEELYKRLGGERDTQGYIVKQGAYQLLENYNVDYVLPLGVYADDKLIGKYDDFAYQLALACAVMSHFNSVTIGLMATSSPSDFDLKSIEDHVRKLEGIKNEYYMLDRFGNKILDSEGQAIDLGQFLEIVAGPDILVNNTRLGVIATGDPALYAGFVSTLPVQSAPTNKDLPGALGLRYEYSTSQLNRLARKRFVTYRMKSNGRVGITDAMTSAAAGSDYTRLMTVRIVKAAVNTIRRVSEPFIGEPNDIGNRNALTSAIAKEMEKMKEAKALLGYDFQVIATPQMELMGEAQIELKLQAPNELRKLTTVVSLTV